MLERAGSVHARRYRLPPMPTRALAPRGHRRARCPPAPRRRRAPQIHAHRGGTVENGKPRYAEESLAAYKHAARNGFVLEVDAKLTEDGVPVAIHDATLDRTTTCTGEVRTFTLAELRGLQHRRARQPRRRAATAQASSRAADHHDRRVLELARMTGAIVNLEIKNVPTDPDYDSTPAYANRVMDAVIASRLPRCQLIIQSFVPANLDVAVQRLPRRRAPACCRSRR